MAQFVSNGNIKDAMASVKGAAVLLGMNPTITYR